MKFESRRDALALALFLILPPLLGSYLVALLNGMELSETLIFLTGSYFTGIPFWLFCCVFLSPFMAGSFFVFFALRDKSFGFWGVTLGSSVSFLFFPLFIFTLSQTFNFFAFSHLLAAGIAGFVTSALAQRIYTSPSKPKAAQS